MNILSLIFVITLTQALSFNSLSNIPVSNKYKPLSFLNKGINKVKGVWEEFYNMSMDVVLLQNYNGINNPYVIYPDYHIKRFHIW